MEGKKNPPGQKLNEKLEKKPENRTNDSNGSRLKNVPHVLVNDENVEVVPSLVTNKIITQSSTANESDPATQAGLVAGASLDTPNTQMTTHENDKSRLKQLRNLTVGWHGAEEDTKKEPKIIKFDDIRTHRRDTHAHRRDTQAHHDTHDHHDDTSGLNRITLHRKYIEYKQNQSIHEKSTRTFKMSPHLHTHQQEETASQIAIRNNSWDSKWDVYMGGEYHESDRQESDKQESDRQESDKQESDKQKSDKQESDKQKSDKQKSDKQESDKQKSDKQESDKQKSDKQESDKQKSEIFDIAQDKEIIIKKSIVTEDYTVPQDAPIVQRKTKMHHVKNYLFGFGSKLTKQRGLLFAEGETSSTDFSNKFEDSTEKSNNKDMSWLLDLSPSENDKSKIPIVENRAERQNIKDTLYLFWTFLLIGARMPFVFIKNPNPTNQTVVCKFDRRRRNYYGFVITSIFLLVLSVVSLISFVLVFLEEEDKKKPYRQVERLLFSKNWVTGLVFLGSLVTATIASLNILLNGVKMAEYTTQWSNSLDGINFNAAFGIKIVVMVFIIWSTVQAVLELVIFWISSELNIFIEEIHFLTILIFRTFVERILLSEYINIYAGITLFLKIYVLYCSRTFIFLVIIYSIGINNLANEWNFRLRLILQQIAIKKNEFTLSSLFPNLTYQGMFDQHLNIIKLMKGLSNTFGTILLSFYVILSLMAAGELLETSIYFVQNQTSNFTETSAQRVNYTYEKDIYNEIYVCFHLTQTVAVFLIVSWYLSDTGKTVMEGLFHTRRHNFMNIVSTHQRDFVISITMRFSERNPYLINAGGLFNIDRSFMFSFFAGLLYFFSVMLQSQIPKIISVPIIFECPSPPGTLCIGTMTTDDVERSHNMSIDAWNKTHNGSNDNVTSNTALTSIFTSTTLSMTTTTLSTTVSPFPCISGSTTSAVLTQQHYRCSGTEVSRLHVYKNNGIKIPQKHKTLDCIYDPYPINEGPYYDCFGNNINDRDDCGMLNFGYNTTLPRKRNLQIYKDHRRGKELNCWDFDSKYYNNANQKPDDIWFPCGIPSWIAISVCKRRLYDTPLTLQAFQKRIKDFLFDPENDPIKDNIMCNPRISKNNIVEVVRIGSSTLTKNYTQSILPLGEKTRIHFPFFHPALLGNNNDYFVYHCPNQSGNLVKFSLHHDDCGDLNFGTKTEPTCNFGFCCWEKQLGINCDATACEAWNKWYSNSLNQPIL